MTSHEADQSAQAFVEDLAAERDRLTKDLIAAVHASAALDERRDVLEQGLNEMTQGFADLATLRQRVGPSSHPTDVAELEEVSLLAEQARVQIVEGLLRLQQDELEDLNTASRLRERFIRLQMSTKHVEEVERLVRGFEQRRQDLERMVDVVVKAATAGSPSAAVVEPGEQLGKVVEAYGQMQVREGAWTTKSELEIMSGLRLWLRIVGDQPIDRYDVRQHRTFKATLQRLPANINKVPRFRGLSIEALLALDEPAAAVNTVRKQLTRVAALFGWAVKHGYCASNPAAGMVTKRAVRASDERQAFTDSDLDKLFRSRAYREDGHREGYMFWTPLIALYTGARQAEIAQLHVADFVDVDGIPCIDINDAGESKRIKTKASKRRIPIHPELQRLGLLLRVEELRQRREQQLFPELKPGRDGYGQTVSRWFKRYRERCGVVDQGKVFHSFRHTVIDCLKQNGHTKERIAALVGHEVNDITMGRYGKTFHVQTMVEVVNALDFTQHTAAIRFGPDPKTRHRP